MNNKLYCEKCYRYAIFQVISTVIKIYIFILFLQISRSEQLLTFVMNMKRCINTKKKALLLVYLLITEIPSYWSYGDGIALPRTWKSNSSEMEIHVLCSL